MSDHHAPVLTREEWAADQVHRGPITITATRDGVLELQSDHPVDGTVSLAIGAPATLRALVALALRALAHAGDPLFRRAEVERLCEAAREMRAAESIGGATEIEGDVEAMGDLLGFLLPPAPPGAPPPDVPWRGQVYSIDVSQGRFYVCVHEDGSRHVGLSVPAGADPAQVRPWTPDLGSWAVQPG